MNDKINLNEAEASRIVTDRRRFLMQAGGGLSALAGMSLLSSTAFAQKEKKKDGRYFRFAVIADTHIIDDFYKGPEGNALDTETIFLTNKRLKASQISINNLCI